MRLCTKTSESRAPRFVSWLLMVSTIIWGCGRVFTLPKRKESLTSTKFRESNRQVGRVALIWLPQPRTARHFTNSVQSLCSSLSARTTVGPSVNQLTQKRLETTSKLSLIRWTLRLFKEKWTPLIITWGSLVSLFISIWRSSKKISAWYLKTPASTTSQQQFTISTPNN